MSECWPTGGASSRRAARIGSGLSSARSSTTIWSRASSGASLDWARPGYVLMAYVSAGSMTYRPSSNARSSAQRSRASSRIPPRCRSSRPYTVPSALRTTSWALLSARTTDPPRRRPQQLQTLSPPLPLLTSPPWSQSTPSNRLRRRSSGNATTSWRSCDRTR